MYWLLPDGERCIDGRCSRYSPKPSFDEPKPSEARGGISRPEVPPRELYDDGSMRKGADDPGGGSVMRGRASEGYDPLMRRW